MNIQNLIKPICVSNIMIRETQHFRVLFKITMFPLKYLLNVFNNLLNLSASLSFPIHFGLLVALNINFYLA